MKLKYFTYEEFDSPDVQGSGQLMNEELLNMLDVVRKNTVNLLLLIQVTEL